MTFRDCAITQSLRVVRFGGAELPEKQALNDLRELVEECEDVYPGIDVWFGKKVKTGFTSGERSAFLVYQDGLPVAGTILRKGSSAKLCSMRILEDSQRNGLGTLLMSLVAAEARRLSERIHFTAPYEVWSKWESFFRSFGFTDYGFAKTQYRLFDDELVCGADFDDIWKAVLRKLPQTVENLTVNDSPGSCDLVISVKPAFAARIVSGAKRIEIRRRFPDKWEGARVLIYSSSPARQFVGEAVIEKVLTKPVDDIWAECKKDIGCTHGQFMAYCHGAKQVAALVFSEIKRFKKPIKKADMQSMIGRNLSSPQSYRKIDTNSAWPTAISLSCLLGTGLIC